MSVDYKKFIESESIKAAYGEKKAQFWKEKFRPLAENFDKNSSFGGLSFNIWGLIFSGLYLAYHRSKYWVGTIIILAFLNSMIVDAFETTKSPLWTYSLYGLLLLYPAVYANRFIFQGRSEEFAKFGTCAKPSWLNVVFGLVLWISVVLIHEYIRDSNISNVADSHSSISNVANPLDNYGCNDLVENLPGTYMQNSFGTKMEFLKITSIVETYRSEDSILCNGDAILSTGRSNFTANFFLDGDEVFYEVNQTR